MEARPTWLSDGMAPGPCLCDMVSAAVTDAVQWRVRSSMIPTSVLLSVYSVQEEEGSVKRKYSDLM